MNIKAEVNLFILDVIQISEQILIRKPSEWAVPKKLKDENLRLFKYLLEYESSILNPEKSSPECAALCREFFRIVPHGYRGESVSFAEYYRLDDEIKASSYSDACFAVILQNFKHGRIEKDAVLAFTREYLSDYYNTILVQTTQKDEKVLYRYGRYIDKREIELFRFLTDYDQSRLEQMAEHIVESFLHGFISQRKSINKRNTVYLHFQIGQEPIALKVIKAFEHRGFRVIIQTIGSLIPFCQFQADQMYDQIIYLDDEYVAAYISSFKREAAANRKHLENICGYTKIIQFGDDTSRKTVRRSGFMSNKDLLRRDLKKRTAQRQSIDAFVNPSEISLCKVAFPNTAIGRKFPRIFTGLLEVNLESSRRAEELQKLLIEALDHAVSIRVEGSKQAGNLTDIIIAMQPITNPSTETNFLNGGGDINIPYGEVFTTPSLFGTNGVLYFKEIYLRDIFFNNLKIHFTNGVADKWSCGDFADRQEGELFIVNTLFAPHNTLPIGEFAIGTNTGAYAFVERFKIRKLLPTLLIEKMGPHFALGDPCFAHIEDTRIFNLIDGKEITARENERTKKRHSDAAAAYTDTHIDMAIPFEEIECIQVITKDGNFIDIIKKGQFVLPGLEELNEPLRDLISCNSCEGDAL
jgi:aminopeptidase